MTKMNTFKKIREVVKQIPRGKVSTYGSVANAVGRKDARLVGWAVYGNQDKTIPCHRVVQKNGELAKKFSLGGWQEQKKRLKKEGITFNRQKQVNLKKHFWQPF